MTVTRSWHVDAPVETVFDYFKDPMKWREDALMEVHDVKVTKDGVGTSFEWGFKVRGVGIGGFDVLTEVVPNERITERSSLSMVGKWLYTFEREGSGSKVTIELQPQSFWRFPPLDRLVGFGFARMSDAGMPRYISAIESSAKKPRAPRKQPARR